MRIYITSCCRIIRGVVRTSVARLHTRVDELERSGDNLETINRLTARLQTLAEEFKVHHYVVIDLIEDEGDLAKEQETLDNFDDDVTQLISRLEKLASSEPSTGPSPSKLQLDV